MYFICRSAIWKSIRILVFASSHLRDTDYRIVLSHEEHLELENQLHMYTLIMMQKRGSGSL